MKKFVKILVYLILLYLMSFVTYGLNFDLESTYNSIYVIEDYNSSGSGFAVGNNAILTNAHVIKSNSNIIVRTYKGNIYYATPKYVDRDFDIALLVVNNNDLIPLPMSDNKDLKVGDDVYAIGSPEGLDYTLTKGIVSNLNRKIGNHNYIQTDTSLNPGNSGGPLLDDSGFVVGINTMKITNADGLNLAIPITEAITRLRDNGIELSNVENNTQAIIVPTENDVIINSKNKNDDSREDNNERNVIIDSNNDFIAMHYNTFILISCVTVLLIIIIIFLFYRTKKNIYHKFDNRERTNFDIDIME